MEVASSSTLIRVRCQSQSWCRGTKQCEEVIIYGVEAFVSHVATGGAVVKLRSSDPWSDLNLRQSDPIRMNSASTQTQWSGSTKKEEIKGLLSRGALGYLDATLTLLWLQSSPQCWIRTDTTCTHSSYVTTLWQGIVNLTRNCFQALHNTSMVSFTRTRITSPCTNAQFWWTWSPLFGGHRRMRICQGLEGITKGM